MSQQEMSISSCEIRIKLSFNDCVQSSGPLRCWSLVDLNALRKVCDLEYIIRKKYDVKGIVDLALDGFHLPHQEAIGVIRDGDEITVSQCQHCETSKQVDHERTSNSKQKRKKDASNASQVEASRAKEQSHTRADDMINAKEKTKKKKRKIVEENDEDLQVSPKKKKMQTLSNTKEKATEKAKKKQKMKSKFSNGSLKAKSKDAETTDQQSSATTIVSSNLTKGKKPKKLKKVSFSFESLPLQASTPNPNRVGSISKGMDKIEMPIFSPRATVVPQRPGKKERPKKTGANHIRFDADSEEDSAESANDEAIDEPMSSLPAECSFTEGNKKQPQKATPHNVPTPTATYDNTPKKAEQIKSRKSLETRSPLFDSPAMMLCRKTKVCMPKKDALKDTVTNTSTLILNCGNGTFCLVEKYPSGSIVRQE